MQLQLLPYTVIGKTRPEGILLLALGIYSWCEHQANPHHQTGKWNVIEGEEALKWAKCFFPNQSCSFIPPLHVEIFH